MYGANELDVPPQVVLQRFEQEQHVRAGVKPIAWDNGRSQLVNMALYKKGADVSEMGTTWLSGFTAMNGLRPFSEQEIGRLGGSAAFLPISWQTGVGDDGQVWAIPWLADTRVIYYRRDWLARAGIAEETAFATFEKLGETLGVLKASGVAMPWLIPTHQGAITLHSVAPWVWA